MNTVYTLVDLKKAINCESKIVWPYLYVKHLKIAIINDVFTITRGNDTSYCQAKHIVKTVNEIVS